MIAQVAQRFAGPGIVFKIDVHNAKDIQPFSYYGNMEGELLLSPNMVSPGPISLEPLAPSSHFCVNGEAVR